jgi:GxxExxY protein
LETDLKLDILVDDIVVVELKTAESFLPIHEAKLLIHLHLLALPKGILINFKCRNIIKEGQKTLVTKKFFELPDGY